VAEAEWRQARDIFRPDIVTFGVELTESGIHVDGVPEYDEIDDQAERSELIFLSFTIALAQFAALSMKDDAGELVAAFSAIELVAAFSAIELDEDAASVAFIIDELQEIEGFNEPTEFLQGAGETGRPVVGLEGPGEACGLNDPELERACKPQQIVPMVGDQLHVDLVRRDIIEDAVVGFCVHAPESCAANVSNAGAELVSEQMEYAEDRISIAGRVGHDLGRLKLGLLFENDGEEIKTVAQSARYGREQQPDPPWCVRG